MSTETIEITEQEVRALLRAGVKFDAYLSVNNDARFTRYYVYLLQRDTQQDYSIITKVKHNMLNFASVNAALLFIEELLSASAQILHVDMSYSSSERIKDSAHERMSAYTQKRVAEQRERRAAEKKQQQLSLETESPAPAPTPRRARGKKGEQT